MELGQDLVRATAGEAFTPRRTRGGPGRRRRGVPARDRAREGAGRRPDPGRGAPRDRRRAAREGPCVVHRTDPARRAHRDRAARGRRRGARGDAARAPDRAGRLRGRGPLPGSARALRTPRRPPRRDGVDHRYGVPELGAGHPPGLELGAAHRGDPPADLEGEGLHERERARGLRGADALRGPRVRPREGDPGSRALAGRTGARARARDGRSLARVPGGRRNRDGARRHGRGGAGETVAGSSGGDRLGASDPSPRASPGDVARDRPLGRR